MPRKRTNRKSIHPNARDIVVAYLCNKIRLDHQRALASDRVEALKGRAETGFLIFGLCALAYSVFAFGDLLQDGGGTFLDEHWRVLSFTALFGFIGLIFFIVYWLPAYSLLSGYNDVEVKQWLEAMFGLAPFKLGLMQGISIPHPSAKFNFDKIVFDDPIQDEYHDEIVGAPRTSIRPRAPEWLWSKFANYYRSYDGKKYVKTKLKIADFKEIFLEQAGFGGQWSALMNSMIYDQAKSH